MKPQYLPLRSFITFATVPVYLHDDTSIEASSLFSEALLVSESKSFVNSPMSFIPSELLFNSLTHFSFVNKKILIDASIFFLKLTLSDKHTIILPQYLSMAFSSLIDGWFPDT